MNFGEKLKEIMGKAREKNRGLLSPEEWIKIANDLHEKEKKKANRGVRPSTTTDEEWLLELDKEPSLEGVAIRKQLAECQFWCKNNRKICTRKRFLSWLSRADRVVKHPGGEITLLENNVYVEPSLWKTSKRAQAKLGLSDESWALVVERGWFNLTSDIRKDILRAL